MASVLTAAEQHHSIIHILPIHFAPFLCTIAYTLYTAAHFGFFPAANLLKSTWRVAILYYL
jgi:hypothetical protein